MTTAEVIGQSVGSDASPLSCFLFRPRKSRKSAGNAVISTFPTHWSHGLQHLRHKRRNVRFNGLRRVHTPPQPLTAHTAAYTAKHGALWMGALSLPSELFARFGNPARPGVRTAYFAAFEPWSRGALEECRKPAGQRCVHARRCSEASRPRWAALPAAASCAASTISEVRYPCTEAQRKNYRLRHTSDCPASLACALLRAADSSNAQSC